MEMNCAKTKFMVINGSEYDRTDINIDDEFISHCTKYTYLGAVIHEDTSFKQFIEEHVALKDKIVLKFYSFLNKNADLPYTLKRRVLEACLFSSLIYSCESWYSDKLGKLNTLYMASVKAALGVRESCPNIIALLEGGFARLSAIIKERQYRFFKKLINSRAQLDDDPFMLMLGTARMNNTPASQYIDSILKCTAVSFIDSDVKEMRDQLRQAAGSKFITYRQINTELQKHGMYERNSISEFKRLAVTRFRTSSHRLKIETGRWSRIPHERRLCNCGLAEVQDEKHVIETCLHLSELKLTFPNLDFRLEAFFDND